MTQNLKIRACFKQNFMELDVRKILDPKAVTFGVWGLTTSLRQVGSERRISSHKSETLTPISQTGPHFLQNHNMNPIKSPNFKKYLDLGVWGLETIFDSLGPRRRI